MSKFQPSKLRVTFFPPATPFKPVDERKYTLARDNEAGDLILTVGYCYDESAVDPVYHNEILAQWIYRRGQYILSGKVLIDGQDVDEQYAKNRFLVFQRELQGALTAIVSGDRGFFENYPWLLDSPIYIHFESNIPQYNQVFYYGKPRQYLMTIKHESIS